MEYFFDKAMTAGASILILNYASSMNDKFSTFFSRVKKTASAYSAARNGGSTNFFITHTLQQHNK
jgi:hypothetical protein